MNKQFFKGWSAQAWCSKENEHKEMDVTLATEIGRLADIQIKPLLKQLKEAREIIEMHAKHGSPASKEFLERWKE